jgi:cell division FtsZ-interacting protein ZapD
LKNKEVSMPSKSQAQHNFFRAVANSKDFAEKAGVKQSVAAKFLKEDEEADLWQTKDVVKDEVLDELIKHE